MIPESDPRVREAQMWLRDNANEDVQRHARRVTGRCEYCGEESHHSTNGACDFTFRAQVRIQPHIVRNLLAEVVSLTTRIEQLEQELAYWKTCKLCGQLMEEPGYCSDGIAEDVAGYKVMHEQTLTRAEQAEARVKELEKALEWAEKLEALRAAQGA